MWWRKSWRAHPTANHHEKILMSNIYEKDIYNKRVVDEFEVTTNSHMSLKGASSIGDSSSSSSASKVPPTSASGVEGRALRGFKTSSKSSVSLSDANIWRLENIAARMDAPEVKQTIISTCKQMTTYMIRIDWENQANIWIKNILSATYLWKLLNLQQ